MSTPGRARLDKCARSSVPSMLDSRFWIPPQGYCWKWLSIWLRALSEPLLWMPLKELSKGGTSSTVAHLLPFLLIGLPSKPSITCPFIEKLPLLLSKELSSRFLPLASRLFTCLHHIKEEEGLGCLVVLV